MNDTKDWMVFQQDVLDVLRQYQGFFDYTERVGGLRDNSRPDFVARVSRTEKKEIWIVDAKKKPQVDSEDKNRMKKYLDMLESNPIDLGLEVSEISDYVFRGIFVTSREKIQVQDYEQIKFSELHQFLQNELVYTDTVKVVRDIAKMAERKQLSQSQARLLYRSLKPFQRRRERGIAKLEEIEKNYEGFNLKTPPFEASLPVEALLEHKYREKLFLIDIPYSRDAVKNIGKKVHEIKKLFSEKKQDVYFGAIDSFKIRTGSEYIYEINELERELSDTAGIISPKDIAELFTPKIPTKSVKKDSFLEVKDERDVGFRLNVYSEDDINYELKAHIGEKPALKMKDRLMNSREQLGYVNNCKFELNFKVTENRKIKYKDIEESLQIFRDKVRTIYQSSVSTELGKKI